MSKTTWERTSVQNLLRNASSGRYFGRWTVGGKQIWRKLDTDVFSVAKLRLADEASKIEGLRRSGAAVTSGNGTMGDLIRVYQERAQNREDLKPSSVAARTVALKKLTKTWPGIDELKPAQITPAAVQAWAARFKEEGTNFAPPGAKTRIIGNSATSVNRAIDTLRRLMDIAIQRGAIHLNPVTVKPEEGRLKKKVRRAKLNRDALPSAENLERLFAAMENNGAVGGWGIEAADFCRFMNYSGCRVGEVPQVTWNCVKWDRTELVVRGYKSVKADRIVPLFADLEALLKRIIERRKRAAKFSENGNPTGLAAADRVFKLSECQRSIDAACQRIGIERLTHHDFRHLFATRCIEAGVDFLTLSRWMGHEDATLVMSTYGHLRDDHSQSMAKKVSFTSQAPTSGTPTPT